MSTPSTDFIFPRPLRRLLWVAGGLIFYAQATIGLIGKYQIYSAGGAPPLPAWITLVELLWHAPAKIHAFHPNQIISDAPTALLIGAIGSLSMFLLASMRMRWFSWLILVLCLPFSLVAAFLIAMIGRLEGEDSGMDPPWMAFGENTTNLAHSKLEEFLGVLLPLMSYPVAFCLALLIVVVRSGVASGRKGVTHLNAEDDDLPAKTRG
jgi:hypothetical protein